MNYYFISLPLPYRIKGRKLFCFTLTSEMSHGKLPAAVATATETMETEDFIYYQELYSDWYEDFPEYFHIQSDVESNNDNNTPETNKNQSNPEYCDHESPEALLMDLADCADEPSPALPHSSHDCNTNDDGPFIDLCQLFWQIMPQECASFYEENVGPHSSLQADLQAMQWHQPPEAPQKVKHIRIPDRMTPTSSTDTSRRGNLLAFGPFKYHQGGYHHVALVQNDLFRRSKKNKKEIVCSFPGCTFITRKKAHRYQQYCSLHDPRSRPIFICTICSEEFRSDPELQKHIEMHTKGKGFQCPLCVFKGAKESSLTRHLKSKHREEPFGQLQTEQN